jgi:hypothetical protein
MLTAISEAGVGERPRLGVAQGRGRTITSGRPHPKKYVLSELEATDACPLRCLRETSTDLTKVKKERRDV